MPNKLLAVFLLSVLFHTCPAQDPRTRWVDSVFATMNRQARAAQLFMVSTPANPTPDELDDILSLTKNGIGGIYITHGGPKGHVSLVNKLQKISPRKLLVGTSAEWGVGQTLDSIIGFPKPMMAGAWKSDSLTVLWGKAIARQMKELGFHVNFAPNADDEIFEGDYLRYFGDNEKRIGRQAGVLVSAMQSEGILAVAEHLPRRWSNERPLSDSMVVLNLNRIDTNSLHPLQQLIAGNVGGISTSYLHFSIQNEQGIVPASVSQAFISEVLRKMLGFKGLVFSDAKNLQQKQGKVRAGEAELLAFQTGADLIFNSMNPSSGIKKISKVARKNKVLEAQLNLSVKRILSAKYDAGLNHIKLTNPDNLYRRLNDPEYKNLNNLLAASTVTIVQNSDSLLPIRTVENISCTSISIGKDVGNDFEQALKKFTNFNSFAVKEPGDTAAVSLGDRDVVVVGIFPYASALELKIKEWINRLTSTHKVILVHFGNPKSLVFYTQSRVLIAAYTDQNNMPSAAAQVIFGATAGVGQLPLNVSAWKNGTSQTTRATDRLAYGAPEAAGMSSRVLEKISVIMDEAIAMGATPGCQTLIAKDGKIVYEQSAGWLTYDKKTPVTSGTIFDLASLTKISATLQTVMFMHDHGLIDINKKVSVYLPELKNSNKADFTIKDILTHQAGLWPFLPFWAQTMNGKEPMPEYYSSTLSDDYPFPVSENLFASRSMKDSLWQWIIKARIRDKPPRTPYDYRYSDMGFYIMQHLAEKLLNQPMEDFLAQNLYEPLGATTTGYLPLNRFPADRIAPTERDTLFRRSLLVGYVHDQGAAMHGGIAGHAGLFSTANDLAKLGQMWLQKGRYAGYEYFKPETIELFSSRQFTDSRRGLGWDKPMPGDWASPTARQASSKTFGHTGFTGTCIWVDPEFNLVYIFLSNRVQPDMNNNKLLNANIRPRIQQVIYEAIFDYCASKN